LAYRFTKTSEGGPRERRERLVSELDGAPVVRSGNAMFDGLFALGIADLEFNRVSQIRDSAFDEGRPIDCVCFETGEKWPYVWTRDISYATDLSLSLLDPQRALNSLLFKTSEIRTDLLSDRLRPMTVVAQDTGSGRSWPVSTDRVVWIVAASDVLESLPAAARGALVAKLYRIARDTVEQDRRFAFDTYAGLYRGETSFLDWREQNYSEWTRNDVVSIAAGYAFSTNVLHVVALRRTAELGKEAGDPLAAHYLQWADDLQRTINTRFWQNARGLYASYLSAEPNAVPANSYDLLGLSLAIIYGIANERQVLSIVQNYPISDAGPPVLWPEQAGIAIYHNRAIWPFVTAYALRAAKIAKHPQLAEELALSLMRGTALSLSNMENFEFLTQKTRFEDGALSGPVVNSPRQLWSVAGYLSMVLDTLWGLKVHEDHISFEPWLPSRLAHAMFGGQRTVSLHDIRVGGTSLNVTLELPREWPSTGWLEQLSTRLNGERMTGSTVPLDRLLPGAVNELRVTLRPTNGPKRSIVRIPNFDTRSLALSERRAVFAPLSPSLAAAKRMDADVILTWQGVDPGSSVQIYRNGRQVIADAPGERFVDRPTNDQDMVCYSLTQRFDDTDLASLSSRDICVPSSASITLSAGRGLGPMLDGASPSGGLKAGSDAPLSINDGIAHYADWGLPSQTLLARFTPQASGWYRFALKYANLNGPINSGITAAVKSVTVRCAGETPRFGSVVMPHSVEANSWGLSTALIFNANANEACEVLIEDGFNMSYLTHFSRYTGGRGGASGPLNRVDIGGAQIDRIRRLIP
jgi:hypothetical protein